MSLLRLKTPAPGTVAPATFFGHVLPTLLQDADDARTRDGGRFAFDVRGDGGGAWTVDLEARSVAPALQDADVVLTLSTTACSALLDGRVRPGDVAVVGDARLLRRLADLLLAFAASADARPEGVPT
jgi:hypothetical protein